LHTQAYSSPHIRQPASWIFPKFVIAWNICEISTPICIL